MAPRRTTRCSPAPCCPTNGSGSWPHSAPGARSWSRRASGWKTTSGSSTSPSDTPPRGSRACSGSWVSSAGYRSKTSRRAALIDRFAKHRRFRGIRVPGANLLAGLADEGYTARLGKLADHGLTLDVNHGPVLEAVEVAAARFPELRIVINHMANTRITSAGPLPEWLAGIEKVARRPNVWMKVSARRECGLLDEPAEGPVDLRFTSPGSMPCGRLLASSGCSMAATGPYRTTLPRIPTCSASWTRMRGPAARRPSGGFSPTPPGRPTAGSDGRLRVTSGGESERSASRKPVSATPHARLAPLPPAFPAAAGAAGSLLLVGTRSSRAIAGANDRVRIAVIGVNGRGWEHLAGYGKAPGVGDRHRRRCRSEGTRPHARRLAKEAGDKPLVTKGERDFRRVLEDKTIDAISIATPNHWHSLMTIWAGPGGQARLCREAAAATTSPRAGSPSRPQKKYNVVVQHGTQRRSSAGIAGLHQAIHDGKFGKLKISYGYACKARAGSASRSPTDPAGEPGLEPVARARPVENLPREPRALQLALVLGDRQRRDEQSGHPPAGHGPLGDSTD